MSLRNKNKIYIVTTAAIFIVAGLSVWHFHTSPLPVSPLIMSPLTASDLSAIKTVQINGVDINVELATTEAEQLQGLSGRTSLATSTGMLFVFANPANWGIWMKDMNFPIDVLWITDDLKVSDIVENMTPASYPKVYVPHVPTRYVLEVSAGMVKRYDWVVGQDVVLK